MSILIIYAHPSDTGHNAAIFAEVKKQLRDAKKPFDVIDLYHEEYDPVMRKEELYTQGGKPSPRTLKYQSMITKADRLIFIYPVWWNSMPAIMKGFTEKIFISHYGFKYEGGIPRGLLKGKKASVFITTGTNKLLFNLILSKTGATLMTHNILGFCGIRAKAFHLGGCLRWDESKLPKVRRLVKKGLAYLS